MEEGPWKIDQQIALKWCKDNGVPDYLHHSLARLLHTERLETIRTEDAFWKGVILKVRDGFIDEESDREETERMRRIRDADTEG